MRQSIDAVNDAIWLFSVDGISLKLSQEERRIERSFDNVWLSDTIIDATHAVLRQQFPYEEGMQSVLSAAKLKAFQYFVHVACQSPASCLHVQNVKHGSILAVNSSPKLSAKFDLQKS